MLLKAHPSSCHVPLNQLKNTLLLPCQPIFAVNSWDRTKNYSPPMALTSPSFLVYCCMFWAALGKMTWKMVSVLCDFLYKNWWNSKNSHCFYTKIHSLPLTFSENQGSERPEPTGSKMAMHFMPVLRNLEIHGLHKFGWKWVFFFKGSGFCAIWGSRHLAMIVARGVASSELTEQRC